MLPLVIWPLVPKGTSLMFFLDQLAKKLSFDSFKEVPKLPRDANVAWGAAGTYRRPWSRASALRRRSHDHYRGSRARCDCGRRSTTAISPSSRSFQCGARSRRCAASPEGARLVGRCGGACARGVDVDAKSRARGLQQLDCGARPRCELSLPTGNSFSGLRALPQRRVGAGAKNTWAQCDRCREAAAHRG